MESAGNIQASELLYLEILGRWDLRSRAQLWENRGSGNLLEHQKSCINYYCEHTNESSDDLWRWDLHRACSQNSQNVISQHWSSIFCEGYARV